MAWIAGTLAWLTVAPPLGVLIGRGIHKGQRVTAGSSLPITVCGPGRGARCAIGVSGRRRAAVGSPVCWRCR